MENHEKPECQLINTAGNVFAILGKVRRTLRQHDCAALETFDCELADLQKEGGAYDDVLVLIQKFVDVV